MFTMLSRSALVASLFVAYSSAGKIPEPVSDLPFGSIVASMMPTTVSSAAKSLSRPAWLNLRSISVDECGDCYKGSDEHAFTHKWDAGWAVYTGDALCDGEIGGTPIPEAINWCIRCYNGSPVWCDAGNGSQDYVFDYEEDAYWWITSQTSCGDCDRPGEENELLYALSNEDERVRALEVADLIASSSGKFWLNLERASIQGQGCGSRTATHIPISTNMMSLIAFELGEIGISDSR